MAEIACRRCGETREALPKAPLPGDVGRRILAGTCADCWRVWMGEQTKLINERALSPVNPEHYAILVGELQRFLRLEETGG